MTELKKIGGSPYPRNEAVPNDENPFVVKEGNQLFVTTTDRIKKSHEEFVANVNSNTSKEVILGTPPSKSNGYIIITIKHKNGKSHGALTKTKQLRQYEKDFALQCRVYKNQNIDYPFEFHIDAYLPSRRPDLDGIFKVVLDSLQTCNAIKNDNLCVRIVANKYLDPSNPRIEFQIIKASVRPVIVPLETLQPKR